MYFFLKKVKKVYIYSGLTYRLLILTRCYRSSIMKSILTGILSLLIFFGAVPAAQAVPTKCAYTSEMTCEMACADEDIKKKKKKKGKKLSEKGKKKKKGFFSKVFGSK